MEATQIKFQEKKEMVQQKSDGAWVFGCGNKGIGGETRLQEVEVEGSVRLFEKTGKTRNVRNKIKPRRGMGAKKLLLKSKTCEHLKELVACEKLQ